MKDSGPILKEGRYLVNHLGSKGKENNWQDSRRVHPAASKHGSTLTPRSMCPNLNTASSGGFAVSPEVTIQETYKNGAHDGNNPIRPGALA